MPRDIPVGNGSLLVNLDQTYQLRDLYWPHVGQENHTGGHPSRLGVWVDGQFRWVHDDGDRDVDPTIDASLIGLWHFGMFAPDDPRVVATMQAVRDRLWVKTDVGGLARYENGYYHQISQDIDSVPGNPWFICTQSAR